MDRETLELEILRGTKKKHWLEVLDLNLRIEIIKASQSFEHGKTAFYKDFGKNIDASLMSEINKQLIEKGYKPFDKKTTIKWIERH